MAKRVKRGAGDRRIDDVFEERRCVAGGACASATTSKNETPTKKPAVRASETAAAPGKRGRTKGNSSSNASARGNGQSGGGGSSGGCAIEDVKCVNVEQCARDAATCSDFIASAASADEPRRVGLDWTTLAAVVVALPTFIEEHVCDPCAGAGVSESCVTLQRFATLIRFGAASVVRGR